MRRSVGVGAIRDKKAAQDKFKEKGENLQENAVDLLSSRVDQFRTMLDSFAVKHRSDIKNNADFRKHFQEMCATIGVDPLASSKGFWQELLGMGSFYYEIAVQAVEVVLSKAYITGGVMKVGEIQKTLNQSRSSCVQQPDISCDDIIRSINSLEVLGESCGVIADQRQVHENFIVFCVPEELSLDNTTIIQYVSAAKLTQIDIAGLQETVCLGWPMDRITTAMDQLVKESIVWIDLHDDNCIYWFPSFFYDEWNLSICEFMRKNRKPVDIQQYRLKPLPRHRAKMRQCI